MVGSANNINQVVKTYSTVAHKEVDFHRGYFYSISANTAVYMSASAVVFILSIPVLRERVSVLKVLSVCLTVTGVTLVSVYGKTDSEGPEVTTPMGYVVSII